MKRILTLSKLEVPVFADDNFNITQTIKFSFYRVENIVGKGENAGYQHFLHFPQCFHKIFSTGVSKVMLSGRISRNIGENIFQSYTGHTSENTDFHVLVA